MKPLITFFLLIFTSFGFAQNAGVIVGKVVDTEINNDPLVFAKVSIKGTSIQSESDVTGLFLLENLADGDYTLVCSFVGYDTKEIKVHVNAMQPVEVNFSLSPSTVSLNEIASLNIVAKSDDKTSVAVNN